MHKNFNMMKRYAIPLVKTFGSAALSNVRMNLSASHTRMLFSMAMLVMMLLAPSAVKADVIEIDFNNAALGAYNHEISPNSGSYKASEFVMGDTYSDIAYAKVGNVINYKYSNNGSVDISRLAFAINTNGKANAHDTGYGFYLRAERNTAKKQGLYTGNGNSKFAVLGLKPGDNVKILYAASPNIGQGGANIRINNESISRTWCDQLDNAGAEKEVSIDINFIGDLNVTVNVGTFIEKITITTNPAQYEIKTEGNVSTFEFIDDGTLEENDYAVPYLAASFGSINDYLLVQNGTAHMIKADGSEDLVTDPNNYFQPSAGSFYAFKPTAGGHLKLEGSYQGQVHLFIYDPSKNGDNNNWVQGNSQQGGGQFYVATYSSGNIEFDVEKDKIYYICQDNQNERGNAYHLHKFTFTHTFGLGALAKVIDANSCVDGQMIDLTDIEGVSSTTSRTITVKRCTGNIDPTSLAPEISNGKLKIKKPTFATGTDNAGTVILDVKTGAGDATFVVTFHYHADYRPAGYTGPRSYGHTWNFINPLLSDSNIGNCKKGDGTVADETTGILSIGQDKDTSSQLHIETENREWTRDKRVTGSAGGYHDPMFKNVYDMEGDNADMIWETEGLWFDTGSNLSCLYNESDAYDVSLCNPLDYPKLGTDPDRYVGLLPDAGGASSFTIPGLKDGDRVLIFMKSGEATSTNGIFLNIHGALDAVGTEINESDLYKAGGTNFIKDANHQKYEGCYHFIKKGDGPMKFDLVGGSMCKLLYIRIYSGKRIDTNDIVSGGKLLLANDKGATVGDQVTVSKHYSGKGQHSNFKVLRYSGSLNDDSFNDNNFVISGTYNNFLTFKSTVGEMGIFRVRMTDLTYEYAKSENEKITYVADFCDRNFTVGYRDKVVYPYTWDFTDVNTYSGGKITTEANKYVETNNKYENTGWDISLFDNDGNMKVSTGVDPDNENEIFSADKAGYGNQLWADDGVIAETRGLWFYTDDNNPQYNDCMQITAEGIRFANTKVGSHTPNWNYKMVVPSVPKDGAVYVRMKRDSNVKDDDVLNGTPFLATKFHFGVATADEKTSVSTGTDVINGIGNSSSKYSFYKVPDTDDEYILAVLNTGDANNLTFTLNGWMVEKVAVSTDPKSVNIKGYASESRDHAIDASLTSYLIGKEMKSYLVSDPDYKNHKITLTDVGGTNATYVIPANTGYVIKNEEETELKIINDGFHLFVPDMHDKTGKFASVATNNGFMVPVLEEMTKAKGNTLQPFDGSYTNYILSYKWYELDADGNHISEQHEGDEMFYRVSANGISMHANSAYMQLPTNKVKPSTENPTGSAKFTFCFTDWSDDPVLTAIENANVVETFEATDGVWYNLNGQKFNSKPTTKGLYIVNGKKVLVK